MESEVPKVPKRKPSPAEMARRKREADKKYMRLVEKAKADCMKAEIECYKDYQQKKASEKVVQL